MTDAYTYISKPVGTPYTNVNPQGLEQYDQSSIQYDDINIFYDGVNQSAYTNISKPNGFGLFLWNNMSMSWANANGVWGTNNTGYTNIAKPI